MSYQVARIRPLVYDPLPDDVKPYVVPMDRYWITDEAVSVYRRALAVVSMECHSPIFANAVGRPGIYLRQPTDTWKGQMYPDLGLGEWKVDLEHTSGNDIARLIMSIHHDYDAALETVNQAATKAARLFEQSMNVIKEVIQY